MTTYNPLTAEMLKRHQQVSLPSLPATQRLGEAVCTAIVQILGAWNPIAARASVESISEERVAAERDNFVDFTVRHAAGTMRCSIDCDRIFVLAMADLAFGGTGADAPAMAEERPQSRLETGIRDMFAAAVAEKLPEALEENYGLSGLAINLDTPKDTAGPADIFLQFRMLANVFAYSGEIRLAIRQRELQSILRDGKRSDAAAAPIRTLAANVTECIALIQVALPAELLPVGEIARFEVGQIVPLNATARTPVIGQSAGIAIFTGTLTRSGPYMAVRLT